MKTQIVHQHHFPHRNHSGERDKSLGFLKGNGLMRILLKTISSAFVLCFVFAQAQASITHTFIYDDLSPWVTVSNFLVGDSITFQFADSTDFNNATTSDIEGFGYTLAAGSSEFYLASSYTVPAGNGGDLSNAFSEAAGIVSLTYTNSAVGFIQAVQNGSSGQFIPGQETHVFTQFLDGVVLRAAFLNGLSEPITYTSSPAAVPLPAALPLFLTGLAGLGLMRRRKRQTMRD